jgi:hypothetical protein
MSLLTSLQNWSLFTLRTRMEKRAQGESKRTTSLINQPDIMKCMLQQTKTQWNYNTIQRRILLSIQ